MNQYCYRKILFLFFGAAMLLFMGCQGTRIMVESDPGPRYEPPPSYEKGGPPPWAPAHGRRAKHRYHYYPSSRVYHERERGVWFYYEDGKWQVGVSLPLEVRVNISEYVVLEMDTDRPYEYDHEVYKKHPPGKFKKKKKKHKWKD